LIWGPHRGRERVWAGEEDGKGRGRLGSGNWREGKERAPKVTVEPGPLSALLRHCRNGKITFSENREKQRVRDMMTSSCTNRLIIGTRKKSIDYITGLIAARRYA